MEGGSTRQGKPSIFRVGVRSIEPSVAYRFGKPVKVREGMTILLRFTRGPTPAGNVRSHMGKPLRYQFPVVDLKPEHMPPRNFGEFLPGFVDFRPSSSSSVHDHPKGSLVKYLGLAYFTPDKFAAMAPDHVTALVSQCPSLDEKMRATGKVLVSASLGDLESWRTLRPRNGKTQVTDGPYTESKEVVGGLFIIEADSEDEALHIASMHPAATLGDEGGWAVELIPMGFYLSR